MTTASNTTVDSDSAGAASANTASDNVASEQAAVGLSNAQLSQGRRKMLDLINRLLNTGVQLDIDIPRIAVIGNQSSGKSSLIEAISGTTLPRASGTCTRCPTECRLMYSSEPWKCVVSLRILTDSNGQVLGQARNEPFGAPIYNKAEVEERVRRAQLAILNPNIPRQEILEGDGYVDNVKGSSFSANCVALEISGPNVADLAFCDLPGLIRSTNDGNSRDIELIEGMVESYIQKPSCIILLTVSCETDFMNQGALHLAKKFDPKGERTVGVLTKPDRIETGDENDWLGFIRGETQPLLNGWFCVKQPSTSDLLKGITWTEARVKENDFFSTTAPWRDLELMLQKHLRTPNLVGRLSTILSDLIAKRLPEIRRELDTAIQNAKNAVLKLPKAPSADPLNEISSMIFTFMADVNRHVDGVPNRGGLHQTIRPFQEAFRSKIRMTAPNFKPYECRDGLRAMPPPPFIKHEEEKIEDSLVGSEFEAIYLEEVLRRANDSRTRELPGNHPYLVEEAFVSEITAQWATPTQTFCRETYEAVLRQVVDLVKSYFSEFGQGQLERQMSNIVQDHLRQRYEQTRDRLEWLVKLENRPCTSNMHYFADYRDKFFGFYKGLRQQDKNPELFKDCLKNPKQSIYLREALASLTSLGFDSVKQSDLQKLLPGDEMDPALKIMAEVRAYFQVAYKRFADNVPLVIDYELIQGLERDLLPTLFAKLGIHGANGPEICREFAEENSMIADNREALSKKLERLQVASQELTKL
ncbi:hypothetical protein E1B28_010521 [Marasmius oreades]|uniref:Uncharacterized protein n=1 Tax=Marasmius oreades TaxID=181124 RepID=A0A9P7URV1_9AGAR|nr:uncharacterized protein E1B28_010521 [Marasmius oreades]KAG7091490.1 hypothetical protein E1B28_010521 [Marasmius oreades]